MIETLYSVFLKQPKIQTDTRKLETGDLFFALKGPNFNGNKFAEAAIKQGAAMAIIDDPAYEIPGKTMLVDDVLDSLQQLALYHRKKFSIPFLAITGSNGKTTTKELIHAVLSTSFKTYTTSGNLNNHIGIPLTILSIKADAEIAVLEMGANHQKEIEGYCKIALPTHGLITNCGKAHLEGFGSEEGVRKGKGELFDFLKQTGGTAFVMWDYEYLRKMSEGIKKIIRYGTKDVSITGVAGKSDHFLKIILQNNDGEKTVQTNLVGDYNLPNILAAIAVGIHFGVDEEKIISAIEQYTPSNSRSQWIESGTNKFILDAYNANPSSMKLAIENFASMHADNKVLLLGAMAELGSNSPEEHEAVIELINKYKWKDVVLVGGDFLKIEHPFLQFENSLQAKEWLIKSKFENSVFLIKGSRSLMMEKIIEL